MVLLFDNLETLQDPTTLQLTDELSQAWIEAARALAGPQLTLLLTSRWRLPAWSEADHWLLEHLGYNDYLQLARQQQLPIGLLHNRDRIRQLHQTLHGNARGLEFFAGAIQGLSPDEEAAFLQRLARAGEEVQVDMALQALIAHRSEAQRELLTRMTAYQSAVPLEGIVKLVLDLDQPERCLDQLLAVSLVERHHNRAWQCDEYEVPVPVVESLTKQGLAPPARPSLLAAAEYQHYLFRWERQTLDQAISAHHALRRADHQEQADRLVLDVIIGPLNRRGLYRTLLRDWLPLACQSTLPQIRGEAFGQTGKQYLHLGDYDTALQYLKQSLAIQQEIGDKSGEGATLNNISQIFKARSDYDTALQYLKQSLAIQQEIGDTAGLCVTLFNMGHIHLQNEQVQEALSAWVTVYRLAKPMQLANVLQALAGLAEQLGLPGGMNFWEGQDRP